MDPKHHLAHARVSAFNICIWYVVSSLPPADSAWRLTVERAQLLFRSRHGDTVQFRELRAVGWRLLLPDSLTASQGVLCGGAAVSFSCLYCSLGQPCWQGLAGELAQHFSYCYVSVPGLWTACRGRGSCCSAVCGLQLYLIAEDISWKPHSLWPGIQKEMSLLGGDFLCLPSKNHIFFPFNNVYPNYFPKQLKLLLLFVLKWLIENVLTDNQWAAISVAHIKIIHDDKSHSSANYILLHVCSGIFFFL